MVALRPDLPTDLAFIRLMLFEAFFWRPQQERPEMHAFLAEPEHRHFLHHWGRPGDGAIIAEMNTEPVGAAWYRLWSLEQPGFGFVDEQTPELGIAVLPAYRSRGIGRRLIRALFRRACAEGFDGLSLSVEPENPALHLYESEGFLRVGESGTSWTLVRRPPSWASSPAK